ncbi:hypothetical protein FRB97_008073 [Tulasnella sp. 331]|nr:hypothetical protein FRB97_008073 [Tulasnella sp. 331]
MAPVTSQSQLVPTCKPGTNIVKVWTRKIKPDIWGRTAPSSLKDTNIIDSAFAGIVVATERVVGCMGFTVGDPVVGLVNGGEWVEALDGGNQGYLSVPLESVSRAVSLLDAHRTNPRVSKDVAYL